MTKVAIVFPGQGSQTVGMMKDLNAKFPVVEKLFSQASEILGYDLLAIVNEGSTELLNQTIYTQPAMLVSDVVMWSIFKEVNPSLRPLVLAGHSLGEYAALVAGEAITFSDAVKVVTYRAKCMQEAVPEGKGAMGVALGICEKELIALCHEVSKGNEMAMPANFNSPGQIVFAGTTYAVDEVLRLAKEKGAKIAKKLPMSIPSHSSLLQKAAQTFSLFLRNIVIQPPLIPILHNVDVKTHDDTGDLRQILIEQLIKPVRWIETIQKIAKMGCDTVIECGPGKVLTGLNKRIDGQLKLIALSAQPELRCEL